MQSVVHTYCLLFARRKSLRVFVLYGYPFQYEQIPCQRTQNGQENFSVFYKLNVKLFGIVIYSLYLCT